MMSKVRIGIAGTGSIAEAAHGPAIKELDSAELVSVLSRSAETGRAFLGRHDAASIAEVHTQIECFANDPELDLAIICTPDRLHFDHARACIDAGKHVLLEKPLAVSTAEAQSLVNLANEKKVVLATGFHLRSHAGHRKLRHALAQDAAIGELRHVRVIWAWPNSSNDLWRANSNLGKWWSLAAVGSHCLDLARWFASDHDDWQHFSSTIATNLWGGPHDETAVIAAQLANGVTVEVVSSIQFGPYTRAEFFGAEGSATCEGTLGRGGAGRILINDIEFDFIPTNPFEAQLRNVVSAIAGDEPLMANGTAGLRSVKDLLLALDA